MKKIYGSSPMHFCFLYSSRLVCFSVLSFMQLWFVYSLFPLSCTLLCPAVSPSIADSFRAFPEQSVTGHPRGCSGGASDPSWPRVRQPLLSLSHTSLHFLHHFHLITCHFLSGKVGRPFALWLIDMKRWISLWVITDQKEFKKLAYRILWTAFYVRHELVFVTGWCIR